MLGDWPISGDRIDTKIYSDVDDDIFEIQNAFPDDLSPVRKVNLAVVEMGEKEGVKTYIVPPPLICKSFSISIYAYERFHHFRASFNIFNISWSRDWILHDRIRTSPHGSTSELEEEAGCHDRCWVRGEYVCILFDYRY